MTRREYHGLTTHTHSNYHFKVKLNKQQNTQYKQKQTLIDLAAVVTVPAVVEESEDFEGPPDHQGELE